MRGRTARCRRIAAVSAPAAADRAARPAVTIASVAAAAFSVVVAVLLLLAADTTSASGSTTMTSPDNDAAWRTMDELVRRPGARLSDVFRTAPSRLRHRRHHRRRQRHRPSPLISGGFESSSPLLHSATASGRRKLRHLDDKITSGSDAAVFKVVADRRRPSDNDDPFRLEAETGVVSGLSTYMYFRFCNHRLISSAIDRRRCLDTSGGVARRCIDELAALDADAESKYQQFDDVMSLFDCGHVFSLASGCDDCKVRSALFSNRGLPFDAHCCHGYSYRASFAARPG